MACVFCVCVCVCMHVCVCMCVNVCVSFSIHRKKTMQALLEHTTYPVALLDLMVEYMFGALHLI